VATVTKVTRKVRGKAYEYHAVRFTDPGTGKEKLRYFGTKKEADKARTDIEMRLEAGTYSGEAHKATERASSSASGKPVTFRREKNRYDQLRSPITRRHSRNGSCRGGAPRAWSIFARVRSRAGAMRC
jgi:hypothetical protein